ncbi:hypothetical protein AZC_1930 [Azorhizobium caulinodans ORS 571]|uniref:Uncharacterized protein n=1 Tax=Azorhizobium caulinodans (strain ATCC 43989 / DSM 5975 / JCM 20966 / LMG 6465 / NBRC 14845 / NCIMB 13405 / ORS 571) TaxID=438753 RepID=A8I2T1_AZOC5|nr:hypothetical protein [Azorhizobium caulinodans]BAF87928.1 hypothetical protein AZC_1930 [Azorhizobium caulinodans ORS 571]
MSPLCPSLLGLLIMQDHRFKGCVQRARRRMACVFFLAVMAYGPASGVDAAERSYPDRIFRQTYVLPEGLKADDLSGLQMTLGLTLSAQAPGLQPFNAELTQAMGGQCAAVFAGRTGRYVPATPAQFAIAEKAAAMPASPPIPADSVAFACAAQSMLFQLAQIDARVSDAQLADLAREVQRRFAADWLSLDLLRQPGLAEAAQRYVALFRRVSLLRRVGGAVPDDLPAWLLEGQVRQGLLALQDARAFGALDQTVTAGESHWLAAQPRRAK